MDGDEKGREASEPGMIKKITRGLMHICCRTKLSLRKGGDDGAKGREE